MSIRKWFTALVCTSITVSPGVGSAVKGRTPTAVMPAISVNFGRRPAGSIIRFTVPLKNNTLLPIAIDSVRMSCGCTTARIVSWRIAPGGSDDVLVRIDPMGQTGPLAESVFVLAGRPPQLEWLLHTTGYLTTPQKKKLLGSPREIDLGLPRPGRAETQTICLARSEQANVGILKVKTTVPWIAVIADKKLMTPKEAWYRATITPPLRIGKVREAIRFIGPRKNILRIPVVMNVRPVIGVWPGNVLLMPRQLIYHLMVRPALAKKATLVSFSSKSAGIRILSVRRSKKLMDGKPALDVKAEPVGKGFISATLMLRFKQWNKPVKVMFVGVGK